jgi:hypothetical protein
VAYLANWNVPAQCSALYRGVARSPTTFRHDDSFRASVSEQKRQLGSPIVPDERDPSSKAIVRGSRGRTFMYNQRRYMRPAVLFLALTSMLAEAADPFVGTWHERVDLYRSEPPNTRTIETDGNVIRVRTTLGRPEEYIADGLPRPTTNAAAVSIVSSPSATSYVRRIERDGKMVSTSHLHGVDGREDACGRDHVPDSRRCADAGLYVRPSVAELDSPGPGTQGRNLTRSRRRSSLPNPRTHWS